MLSDVRLKNSVAYPVVEVPLQWAIGALLIWDKITIIWDPDDISHLKDYAVRTPIFIDHGYIELAKPSEHDIINASQRISSALENCRIQPPSDNEFADVIALHPVKVANAYWKHVRRSKDGFVRVPAMVGAAYVGLLAEGIAERKSCPTICMRYNEPLFIAGAGPQRADPENAEDCIVRIALEVCEVKLKVNERVLDNKIIENVCQDIEGLRKLDGWLRWREHLCHYLDTLETLEIAEEMVGEVTSEMSSSMQKYIKEASRLKFSTIAKIGVTVCGGVVGFFVGSIPGAITGAATAFSMLGIDLYQSITEQMERRSGWQHFVLEARNRFS